MSRYLDSAGITALLAEKFSFLKKNGKGTSVKSFFHQVTCFLSDGTDFPISRFNQQLLYHCDKLNVGLIVGGRMYKKARPGIRETEQEYFTTCTKGENAMALY